MNEFVTKVTEFVSNMLAYISEFFSQMPNLLAACTSDDCVSTIILGIEIITLVVFLCVGLARVRPLGFWAATLWCVGSTALDVYFYLQHICKNTTAVVLLALLAKIIIVIVAFRKALLPGIQASRKLKKKAKKAKTRHSKRNDIEYYLISLGTEGGFVLRLRGKQKTELMACTREYASFAEVQLEIKRLRTIAKKVKIEDKSKSSKSSVSYPKLVIVKENEKYFFQLMLGEEEVILRSKFYDDYSDCAFDVKVVKKMLSTKNIYSTTKKYSIHVEEKKEEKNEAEVQEVAVDEEIDEASILIGKLDEDCSALGLNKEETESAIHYTANGMEYVIVSKSIKNQARVYACVSKTVKTEENTTIINQKFEYILVTLASPEDETKVVELVKNALE